MSERNQDEELQNRSPRDSEARTKTERSKTWSPPSLLPTPPDTEDTVFRWIRVATMGEADTRNVSVRFREGWEPVERKDYEELMITSDHDSPWYDKGAIEVGGLLLCKAPREMREQRQAYYQKMSDAHMEAIDNNFMRESDPRMPVLAPERKSRSSFGGS